MIFFYTISAIADDIVTKNVCLLDIVISIDDYSANDII